MGKLMHAHMGQFAALTLVLCAGCYGQIVVNGSGPGGSVRMFPSDLAVLEAGEVRKDLPCSAVSSKPLLGFDLRYHSGYEVSLPLRDIAGNENLLTVLFRVVPIEPKGDPIYLTQRIQ